MRSRSGRGTSRIAMPASAASATDSVSRSSLSAPTATYSAVAGTPVRRHSSTGLRPSTISASSPCLSRRCLASAIFLWTAARLAAGCLVRCSAGGVAPLPSSPRRRTPPEPTVGPFLVPGLRTAPRRCELPAMMVLLFVATGKGPLRAIGRVGDLQTRALEPISDLVGQCPVLFCPCRFAPL
ncbi:Uncharacterised protein [Mycobacteroides abscessus subsp. abscessus]|nr:Uncharacterised protein [Mycobacteroides abscessus subsp. abscessus]